MKEFCLELRENLEIKTPLIETCETGPEQSLEEDELSLLRRT